MNQSPFKHDFLKIPELPPKKEVYNFIAQKKMQFEHRFLTSAGRRHSFSWLVIVFLLLSLGGLGVFTLTEINKNNLTIDELKRSTQIAGVSDQQAFNYPPISGYGFTILPQSPTPENFSLERKTTNFQFLNNRQAVLTSLLRQELKEGNKFKSGIEIEVLEYDNKLNQKEYSELIKQGLGENFQIVSEDITIAKNFKLTKIQNQTDPNSAVFYTTLTTDNYYLIRIYNQLQAFPEFESTAKFTSNLLEWLYLN